jgi:hypothetical protein
MLGVSGRTMRRWMEGVRIPPAIALDRLAALARGLDQLANSAVRAMDDAVPASRVFLVYRRDQDMPPWTQLRTAGCHLALVRRVAERRPDVHLIAFRRGSYRRWLGARADTQEMRAAWAAMRAGYMDEGGGAR